MPAGGIIQTVFSTFPGRFCFGDLIAAIEYSARPVKISFS
jgi:hypothetical protein